MALHHDRKYPLVYILHVAPQRDLLSFVKEICDLCALIPKEINNGFSQKSAEFIH